MAARARLGLTLTLTNPSPSPNPNPNPNPNPKQAPAGFLPLENIVVRPLKDKCQFELAPQDGGLLKSVKMESGDKKKTGGLEQGHHKSFHFKAASPEELELWVQAVRQFAIVDEDLARAVTMKPTLPLPLPYP